MWKKLNKSAIAVAVALMLVLVASCNFRDHAVDYQELQATYPNYDIVQLPSDPYIWIMRSPEGDIYYLETGALKTVKNTKPIKLLLNN